MASAKSSPNNSHETVTDTENLGKLKNGTVGDSSHVVSGNTVQSKITKTSKLEDERNPQSRNCNVAVSIISRNIFSPIYFFPEDLSAQYL